MSKSPISSSSNRQVWAASASTEDRIKALFVVQDVPANGTSSRGRSGGDISVAVVESNGRLIVYAELFIACGGEFRCF